MADPFSSRSDFAASKGCPIDNLSISEGLSLDVSHIVALVSHKNWKIRTELQLDSHLPWRILPNNHLLPPGIHFKMEPDRIGPDKTRRRPLKDRIVDVPRNIIRSLTTKEGLIGDYDYAFLFTPNLPFMKRSRQTAPFFGLNDKMPIFLALILGFQHALAMLAGLITPPIILSGSGGAALDTDTAQYLVSTSLIVCGILSAVQITRFHIYKTNYFIGTGLISVVGTSFATIPVALGGLSQMYASG